MSYEDKDDDPGDDRSLGSDEDSVTVIVTIITLIKKMLSKNLTTWWLDDLQTWWLDDLMTWWCSKLWTWTKASYP